MIDANELRAAAELWLTYHDERPRSAHAVEHAQAKLLAQAWLDANPADAAEAVTREWWEPFTTTGYFYWRALELPSGEMMVMEGSEIGIASRTDFCTLLENPTRGAVRRLLTALGIPSASPRRHRSNSGESNARAAWNARIKPKENA